MLKKEVIQPLSSPWASPIVLVCKKNNSFRFDVTLNMLAGSKWFSILDLVSGYWQVEIAEKERQKTAFCTIEGLLDLI